MPEFIFTDMIQLNSKLDREMQHQYQLYLVATDLGKPALQSQAAINISVLDVIDSAPFFEPSVVDLKINESLPIGSFIYNVTAKDLDLNDRIIYNITTATTTATAAAAAATTPRKDFSLNPHTGQLTLARALDRENTLSYQLTVMATDSALLRPQGNGLTIRITVLDANDNTPRFFQNLYYNDVLENTLEGTIIMSILASDADQGSNGQVSYSIKEELSGLVRIGAKTGLISKHGVWTLASGGFLNFTVIARDGGNPPQYSTVPCSIRLVAVNAINPRFNQSSYSVGLKEDVPIGSPVITLTAYKKGSVDSLSYLLTGGNGHFSIGRNTVGV